MHAFCEELVSNNDKEDFIIESPSAHAPTFSVTPQEIDFDACTDNDLLMLHALISQRLKTKGINGVDLEQEFLAQLAWARGLQKRLVEGSYKPNEQAAALTAANNALKEISRLRDDVYNTEMIRRLEKVVIDIMRGEPPHIRDRFMQKYQAAMEASSAR